MYDAATDDDYHLVCYLITASIVFNFIVFFASTWGRTGLLSTYHNPTASTLHITVVTASFLYLASSLPIYDVDAMVFGRGFDPDAYRLIRYTFCYSLGFFLADVFIMAFYPDKDRNIYLFHHCFGLGTFSTAIFGHVCLPLVFLFFIDEFSTFFYNMRVWARGNGWPRMPKVEIAFGVVFILARIIVNGLITPFTIVFPAYYAMYTRNFDNSWPVFLIFTLDISILILSRILNFYWTSLLIKKAIRMFQGRDDEESDAEGSKKK
eukprot:m.211769 g.211769  ORF g.211769 m.211769 type:complete len:264 (+) comp26147_c0_seq3:384-1175(+)